MHPDLVGAVFTLFLMLPTALVTTMTDADRCALRTRIDDKGRGPEGLPQAAAGSRLALRLPRSRLWVRSAVFSSGFSFLRFPTVPSSTLGWSFALFVVPITSTSTVLALSGHPLVSYPVQF